MNNFCNMLIRLVTSFLLVWFGLLVQPVQADDCSSSINDMTINEVYELGNESWVETRLLDESIEPNEYNNWSLRLCEAKKGCNSYSLADAVVLFPETFPNHFVLEVDGKYTNLLKSGGMDLALLDGTGQCIDYLSVNEFNGQAPSCSGFSYPTATGALVSSLKGVYRDADGTGPWHELESAGATGEPTKGAVNTGLEGTVDHYRIEHPASALTCHTAEVTVRACEDTDCTSYYSDTVDLTLAPVSGWVGGNEPSFDGGSGIFQLRQGNAGSVTLDLSANPAPADANHCYVGSVETDCSIIFYDAGFVVSVPDLTSCQSSGVPFIQAIRKDDESEDCVADGGFANQSKTVRFWSDYLQPASGTEAVHLNSTALATATPGTAVVLSFDNEARSTFALAYDDAGQLQINARYEGSGDEVGLIMTGNDSFVVAPHSLRVQATSDGTTPLDNTTSSDTPHWPAGENFTLEVAGVCSDGTVTTNFAADTELSAVAPFAPVTGDLGTLSGGSLVAADYSSGVAIDSSVYYSEVGTVTVSALATDYLGSGIDVTGSSAPVGRFTPHHFAVSLTPPQFATGCATGSFSYLGQPFDYAVAPVITVFAQNKQNVTTVNYSGDWWKITSGATGSLTGKLYSAATGTVDISNVSVDDPTVSVLGGGIGLLTFAVGDGLFFERSDPLAPFDAEISLEINVVDGDDIAATATATANPVRFGEATAGNGIIFDAGKEMRWGRLVLNNAYGSELVVLPMPMRAEYFDSTIDGDAFVLNGDDSCTSLALTQLSLSNGSGTVPGDNPIAVGSGTTSALPLNPFNGGNANLWFSAPGDEGYVDVTADLSLLDWLRYDWDGDGAHDDNPLGRATFGIYNGQPNLIYLRETFR
jgi:MSHA biogenesis protein MshQ